jgi:hypothetical protein
MCIAQFKVPGVAQVFAAIAQIAEAALRTLRASQAGWLGLTQGSSETRQARVSGLDFFDVAETELFLPAAGSQRLMIRRRPAQILRATSMVHSTTDSSD